MSIASEPVAPGYLWAAQPTAATTWARPAAPQPWGSAPMAPGWPQPMPAPAPAPRRRGLPIGIAATAAAFVAISGLAAAYTHRGHGSTHGHPVTVAAPAAPAPVVRDESLPSLLLDAGAVNAEMGTVAMAVNPKLTAVKLFNDTTDKPECGGVWANVNELAYTGSGWQAVRNQYLREPDKLEHELYESVVSFPTADAAKAFVAKESQRWPLCRNTAITTTNPGVTPTTWLVTDVAQDGDDLTSLSTLEGSAGFTCQHALSARANVVIDVEACGRDLTGQGVSIAHRIAEQITRTL